MSRQLFRCDVVFCCYKHYGAVLGSFVYSFPWSTDLFSGCFMWKALNLFSMTLLLSAVLSFPSPFPTKSSTNRLLFCAVHGISACHTWPFSWEGFLLLILHSRMLCMRFLFAECMLLQLGKISALSSAFSAF
jgi:hypothetical protein